MKLALALAAACLASGCRLGESVLYFPPGRPLFPCKPAEAAGAAALDEEKNGEMLRAIVAPKAKERAFAVFYHGNAECACDRSPLLESFAKIGVRLALAEYPGYAGDKRGPTQERILANALEIYERLKLEAGPLPFLVMGESLGTGPATYVAAKKEAAVLVLVSPYTSVLEAGKVRYPWLPVDSVMKGNEYPADEWAKEVKAPVFMAYGDKDWVVPTALSMKQARNFSPQAQEQVFKGVGHNVILDARREEFMAAFAPFLDAALKR